jgi:hypothetical protein
MKLPELAAVILWARSASTRIPPKGIVMLEAAATDKQTDGLQCRPCGGIDDSPRCLHSLAGQVCKMPFLRCSAFDCLRVPNGVAK